MPAATFLSTFMQTASSDRTGMLSSKGAFNAVPRRADNAADIHEPLYLALCKSTKHKARCPGLVFDQSIKRSLRPSRLGHAKPHICCFKPENHRHVEDADPASRVELGYTEFIVQVTPDSSLDYFIDPDADADDRTLAAHNFVRQFSDENRYKEVVRAYGLHISFATEIFARQQRSFLFTVAIAGSLARFFRWDRSGCIVSRAFDIRDSPDMLAEFLWRYSKLTDAERGFDLTVRVASPKEEELFQSVIKEYVHQQLSATDEELEKAVSLHYQPGHVSSIPVYCDAASTSHSPEEPSQHFLVSRPIISPLIMDGRSTRGYWCVNASTGQVGFLKDTWRTYAQKGSEGDTLQHLNRLGVRNVPLLATHGDGIPQDTQSDQFVDEPWARQIDRKDVIVHRRRHYRIVTYTVGYSLSTLRGTDELLHSTYDVFVAMQDALAKDKRLHRDLSAGNIILVKEPDHPVRRGYLIDWDASIRVDKKGEALQAGRAGTWVFLSARMLSREHAELRHTFEDDMESLIYVILYCALLYLPHRFVALSLATFYTKFFEEFNNVGLDGYGGVAKTANTVDRVWTRRVRFDSPALQEWLDTVLNYHSPMAKDREKYKGMWEPDKLDAYWADFLKTHELERNDRAEHKISMSSRYDPDSPPTVPPTPTPRTPPSPLPSGIDTSSPSEREETPEHKRRLLALIPPEYFPIRPPPQRGPTAPSARATLRRSKRIRDQQKRSQATATIVASTPAAGPSIPRTRGATSAQPRRPGRGRGRGRSRK
ncbi:hypothetical protein GY45DRAFT_1263369 [Cubamyces sp. BRFM 1775]|nr:hypothetical protein GY45DRAFT_1263369 [Cubamyces sp. BRFM 1775]